MKIHFIFKFIVSFSLVSVLFLIFSCVDHSSTLPSPQQSPTTVQSSPTPDLNSDEDGDGLSLQMEMEFSTDPLTPNPNVNYAIENGLKSFIDQVKEFDEDGVQDVEEKNILDQAYTIYFSMMPLEEKELIIKGLLATDNSDFRKVYAQLSHISEKAVYKILGAGLNNTIMEYISYVTSLPDQSNAIYFLENGVCIEDGNLTELEKNYLHNPNGEYRQELYNFYIAEMRNMNSDLVDELQKLPDLKRIEMQDVEAVEDILAVAAENSLSGPIFDEMLDEGIRDKRSYCTPLEALVWIAYDEELEGNRVLEKYNTERLVYEAWRNTSTSNNYQSERWQFKEAVERVGISPGCYAVFARINIKYEFYLTGSGGKYTIQQVYNRKKGNCVDRARTALYFLTNGGGYSTDFRNYDDEACIGFIVYFNRSLKDGTTSHGECAYKENGEVYIINGGAIKGPYKTIVEAGEAIASRFDREMSSYIFFK